MKAFTKIILVASIGVLAAVLFFVLLIQPSLRRVSSLSAQLQDKKLMEVTLDQQIRAYRTAQSDLSKAVLKDDIQAVLVTRENLVNAVQNLEQGAAASGTSHDLKINEDNNPNSKNKPAPVLADKGGLIEVPYRLSTVNDYLGTIEFLSYLEHLPQFTEIYKINLSAELRESSQAAAPVRTGRVLGNFDGIFVIRGAQ